MDVQAYGHTIDIEADGDGHDGVCCGLIVNTIVTLIVEEKVERKTYRLERRFVGLRHGRRRRVEHPEKSSCP